MKRRTVVRLGLRARLLTVGSLPAVRHWDGERLDPRPAPDVAYVREQFLPGVARVEGMPATLGMETVDGVSLVDLFVPVGVAGAGLAEAEAVAADVAYAFRVGVPNGTLTLAETGDPEVRVQLLGASTARALFDGLRLQLPITIRWRSQVPNAVLP